ncbi:MAG: O-antigen ligase family protein [Alphaproteobacteria bacterium]|nr:O-antigen ligase family protein [Alphaproteobacteria bacterium]
MIEDPASGYLAVGATAAVLLVISLFNRWLLILVFLFLAIVGNQLQVDLNLRIDDQSVAPLDIAFAIGALAAGLRMASGRAPDRTQTIWLGFTIVGFIAFLRGMSSYGFEVAATSYRYWFYFSAGTLFVLSFPWQPLHVDRLARLWLGIATVLLILIMILWTAPDLSPLSEDLAMQQVRYAYENQRVVGASVAFLIGQAGMIGLAAWLAVRPVPLIRASGPIFLIVMVLLYHRSVWVAIALGMGVLMLLHRRALYRLSVPIGLGAILLAGALMLGHGLGKDLLAEQIDSAIDEALDQNSTLTWRLEGWQVLLSRAIGEGPVVWVFGSGFGVSYERQLGYSTVTVSPHNLYVELFVNAGLLGVGLLLWFQVRTVRLLYVSANAENPDLLDRRSAIAMMATLMIFSIPYSPSLEQSVWLGALAAMASATLEARKSETAVAARFA